MVVAPVPAAMVENHTHVDAADAVAADEALATISELRECLFDLEWRPHPRQALEARRDHIVQRLHSIAVARLRNASRTAPPRSRR